MTRSRGGRLAPCRKLPRGRVANDCSSKSPMPQISEYKYECMYTYICILYKLHDTRVPYLIEGILSSQGVIGFSGSSETSHADILLRKDPGTVTRACCHFPQRRRASWNQLSWERINWLEGEQKCTGVKVRTLGATGSVRLVSLNPKP